MKKFIQPIEFPEKLFDLQPPKGMKDCVPLPVWTDGEKCISCWKIPFKTRIKLLFSGTLWLWVWGGVSQPPVSIDESYPFESKPTK